MMRSFAAYFAVGCAIAAVILSMFGSSLPGPWWVEIAHGPLALVALLLFAVNLSREAASSPREVEERRADRGRRKKDRDLQEDDDDAAEAEMHEDGHADDDDEDEEVEESAVVVDAPRHPRTSARKPATAASSSSSSTKQRSGVRTKLGAGGAGGGGGTGEDDGDDVASSARVGPPPQASAIDAKLASRLGGRCPLVINYGHMHTLTLGGPTPASSSHQDREHKGPGGVPPGFPQDGLTAGLFGAGAMPGAGGAGPFGGRPAGANVGGGAAAAAAAKDAAKQGAAKQSGKISDYDRVLQQHASSCISRRKAGQDLVDAIKREQSSGGGQEHGDSGSPQSPSVFTWIEDLERKEQKDIVAPARRLQSEFFKRQREGSFGAGGSGGLREGTGGGEGEAKGVEGKAAGGEGEGSDGVAASGVAVAQPQTPQTAHASVDMPVAQADVSHVRPDDGMVVVGKAGGDMAEVSPGASAAEGGEGGVKDEGNGGAQSSSGGSTAISGGGGGMGDHVAGSGVGAPSDSAVLIPGKDSPRTPKGAVPADGPRAKRRAGSGGGSSSSSTRPPSVPSSSVPSSSRLGRARGSGSRAPRAPPRPMTGRTEDDHDDAGATGRTAGDVVGDGDVISTDEGAIKPYNGDLEYLQDQFRVLALLLKKNEILISMREKLLVGRTEAEASGSATSDPIASAMGIAAMAVPHSRKSRARWAANALASGGGAEGDDASGVGGANEIASARKKVEEAEEEIAEVRERIKSRLVTTFEMRNGWIPRVEILTKTLHFEGFEKHVLVLLVREYLISRYLGIAGSGLGATDPDRYYPRPIPSRGMARRYDIKTLCAYFSVTFAEQLQAANRYFSTDSPLVQNGIITFQQVRGYDEFGYASLSSAHASALDASVVVDERLADFLLGLDETPGTEVPVKGGYSVYQPNVSLDSVVLPQQSRTLVEEALEGLKGYWELQNREAMMEDAGGSSTQRRGATVFLLAGRQGTGKSTLANAVATALGKKVLLVDDAGDLPNTALQAKIHDAIVVVEDMKSLQEEDGGGLGGLGLGSLLFGGRSKNKAKEAIKELDTAQNLFIFQTESLESVPASVARRLALVVELQSPDASMRRQIWDALKPAHVELAEDVDLDELATKWVLPGGLIQEAWLTAQVNAALRCGSGAKVIQADLMKAAQRQLHGKLQLANLAEKTTPLRGLDQAVLPQSVKRDLQTMIDYSRVSGVLFGQWGFDLHHGTTRGISALFYGPPGTGKTLAAEILAYELGKPIRKVNLAETISKWVGETEKNLESLLKECKEADVVLFLDECESLLKQRSGHSASYEHRWSNLLLQRIETYEGVLIAATNLCESVDEAYRRRFKYWVQFPKPGPDDRAGIWRTLIPPEAPLASDVDLKALGRRFELTGGEIKSAVFRAAMRGASRAGEEQEITMKDLIEAADEELKKKNENQPRPDMYT